MMKTGEYNTLKIDRRTTVGLYLTDGNEDVLLPNKYIPARIDMDEEITVFVYLDQQERKVATTLEPKIYLNEFALLKVNYVNEIGAFLDWGLEKDLFVPFREQARKMEAGKWYVVYMYLDEKTGRLVASSKLNQFLDNKNLTVSEGDEADLIVTHITEAGINVIINEKHKGLLYKNEVFEDLRTGDRIIGYIKKIRPDGKIDVSRRPLGVANLEQSAQEVYDYLKQNKGFIPLTDKSNPEEIKDLLEMSKKSFKKAIGILYKEKKVDLRPDGVYLLK
ncbi:CvfB family protein [Avrilella dinanensis]|uniref:GntR family transcriptional regulator n=1 Tax=Avrilella dinanensis TaxID=2008672 RepID=A0A2M9R6Y1_9FLAO|nr:S1-like domain-containing RNA-binding protein [Avrilella dinanensis]PJR04627.1 GntR family transcriptional regulator [Avrilella dinanensis]